MTRLVSKESGGTVLDGLYQQLLRRGVHYFLPSSQLEMVGRVTESTAEVVFHATSQAGLSFEWLGDRYMLTNQKELSDHEQKMLRSIGRFLFTKITLFLHYQAGSPKCATF